MPLNYFFKLLVHLLIACLSVLSSRILFFSSCTHFSFLLFGPLSPFPWSLIIALTFLSSSDNYFLKHKPAYMLLSWICVSILNLTWKGAVLDSESPGLLFLLLKIEACALHCSLSQHALFVKPECKSWVWWISGESKQKSKGNSMKETERRFPHNTSVDISACRANKNDRDANPELLSLSRLLQAWRAFPPSVFRELEP